MVVFQLLRKHVSQLVSSAHVSKICQQSTRMISSHKVQVNDVSLHYETAGSGPEPLLLLPGALGSTRTDFSNQLEHMDKDRFTLVAWDPRGYGQSRPPRRDWPLHYLGRDADDAAALMKTLGYSRYSLLGWSDGGITAMIVAARNQSIINNMIVVAGNSYVTKEEREIFLGMKSIDTWSPRMREPFVKVYGDEFRELWAEWCSAFVDYYDKRSGVCVSDDELKSIVCPTLIVHGKKDALVDEQHAHHLTSTIPTAKLHMMQDGKHNMHMRYYQDFNKTVQDFLLQSKDAKL